MTKEGGIDERRMISGGSVGGTRYNSPQTLSRRLSRIMFSMAANHSCLLMELFNKGFNEQWRTTIHDETHEHPFAVSTCWVV